MIHMTNYICEDDKIENSNLPKESQLLPLVAVSKYKTWKEETNCERERVVAESEDDALKNEKLFGNILNKNEG